MLVSLVLLGALVRNLYKTCCYPRPQTLKSYILNLKPVACSCVVIPPHPLQEEKTRTQSTTSAQTLWLKPSSEVDA